MLRQMRPLIKAAVWPRWLLLEATLEEATSSGALHLAALALRTQIEELDALQDVAPLLTLEPRATGDAQLLSNAIEVLSRRLLPRVRTKSADELLAPAGDIIAAETMPRRDRAPSRPSVMAGQVLKVASAFDELSRGRSDCASAALEAPINISPSPIPSFMGPNCD